jgi:hypothetical protein
VLSARTRGDIFDRTQLTADEFNKHASRRLSAGLRPDDRGLEAARMRNSL